MDHQAQAKLRIDKWLWYARLLKTRSLATKFVQAGHVRVNREKISAASHGLKIDDVLTIVINGRVRVLKVANLGVRRGPAPEATGLYEDITPPELQIAAKDAAVPGPSPKRRPDKRERRQIDNFKGGFR